MSHPTHAFASLEFAAHSSLRGPPLGEPARDLPSRVPAERPDREDRLHAQECRQRFLAVCRRELVRRDAERGRRRR